jgi:pyrroloquinoline quinone biosynthesis protein D
MANGSHLFGLRFGASSDDPVSELAARLRRQDGVLAQEAEGRTVLLRLDDGSYYALDEVGAMIWELCDGERSVADVIARLCAEFDAAETTVTVDVVEFVDELRRERLLVDSA